MTDRERWTVYPLLFLTLGIAVKDKLISLSNVDTVLCRTLVVHDRAGKEQVVITSNPGGGLVRTQGTKTGINVLVGHLESAAGLFFVDAGGNVYSRSFTAPLAAPRKPADDAEEQHTPDQPRSDDLQPAEQPPSERK
jgi:hypothetical protein